ncbi:MAG: outer membrane lipoprotein LolB [Rubrivivax sp.]|jgi:outer membrane lipoprotein LolB|nr:outer membrane lipoprotein LolB [Rubrivivax sp.]
MSMCLRFAAGAVALAVAACTQVPGVGDGPVAAPTAASTPSTDATGRLAVAVEAHEGQPAQGFNASFELRGRREMGELLLATATGQRLARLSWKGESALLETPERGVQRYDSLASLSRQMFGEVLPLAALPDWLAGRPMDDVSSQKTAAGFVQLGWTLDLARQTEGLLVARRELPPTIVLRVRLDLP